MNDYTKVSHNIKAQIFHFCKKISKGLSKPNAKFILHMIFGILVSKSVLLSNIARSLDESCLLKKTIERLSNRLKSFGQEERSILFHNYLQSIRSHFDNRSIFCIDLSDITKKYGSHFQHMGEVFDGSRSNPKAKGYNLLEIVGLSDKSSCPLPVYSHLFSNALPDFVSEPEEIVTALKALTSFVGNQGIRALDRGFDSLTYIRYFIENKQSFVLRAKNNRNVIYKGKTKNILTLARSYKGRYVLTFKDNSGKSIRAKVSCVPINLPMLPTIPLYLIICYGYGKEPMLLLSNLPLKEYRLCTTLVKVYLKRWKIEEYFRFKKQQFDLENLRVRSFESIRSLNLLTTLASAFIGLITKKEQAEVSFKLISHYAKRTNKPYKFLYYRMADGLAAIFNLARTTLHSFLRKPHENILVSKQLTLPFLNDTA